MKVYRCRLYSQAEIDRRIPKRRHGWWRDCAAGQVLTLREATDTDLARCIRKPGDTRPAVEFMVEDKPGGALVPKEAIREYRPSERSHR